MVSRRLQLQDIGILNNVQSEEQPITNNNMQSDFLIHMQSNFLRIQI